MTLDHVRNELVQYKYTVVKAIAEAPEPERDRLGFIELDEWIGNSDICFEMLAAMNKGEDFATLDVDQQRWYMVMAGEALYGPELDRELLADCIILANTPI